jgi:hypothetical protein
MQNGIVEYTTRAQRELAKLHHIEATEKARSETFRWFFEYHYGGRCRRRDHLLEARSFALGLTTFSDFVNLVGEPARPVAGASIIVAASYLEHSDTIVRLLRPVRWLSKSRRTLGAASEYCATIFGQFRQDLRDGKLVGVDSFKAGE